jgi:hypothetical protein
MSPEELKQRFRSAAATPPEIDLAEATNLFLTPKPTPPASRPWNPNLLLMLTAITALLAILLSLPSTSPAPELSGFPMDTPPEPAMTVVAPLPQTNFSLTEPETELPAAKLSLTSLAPKTTFAPAAAASKSSRPAPISQIVPTPQATAITPYFYAPIAGNYKRKKTTWFLQIDETEDNHSINYMVPLFLSQAEKDMMKASRKKETSITRPAGTFTTTSKNTFVFVVNQELRSRWNAAGYGDAHINDRELSLAPFLEFFDKEPEGVANSRNLIWLLYFANHIDDDYIGDLLSEGYSEDDLKDLWRLANIGLNHSGLKNLLEMNRQLFNEQPPLKALPALYRKMFQLKSLGYSGKSDLNYQDYLGSDKLFPPMLLSIPGLLSIDSLPIKNLIPLSPLRLLQPTELPKDWGLETPGRSVDTITFSKVYKLKAKGKIRLFFSKDIPENTMVVYAQPGDYDRLVVKKYNRKMILEHQCGGEWIDIKVNRSNIRGITTGKCSIMIFGDGI